LIHFTLAKNYLPPELLVPTDPELLVPPEEEEEEEEDELEGVEYVGAE
jgi:hypothetical protein